MLFLFADLDILRTVMTTHGTFLKVSMKILSEEPLLTFGTMNNFKVTLLRSAKLCEDEEQKEKLKTNLDMSMHRLKISTSQHLSSTAALEVRTFHLRA
jgi:hypothetical protein